MREDFARVREIILTWEETHPNRDSAVERLLSELRKVPHLFDPPVHFVAKGAPHVEPPAMADVPAEMWADIFKHVTDGADLVAAATASQTMQRVLVSNPQVHFDLHDFRRPTPRELACLRGVTWITPWRGLTDFELAALGGSVKRINLSRQESITDAGLQHLAGVEDIDLSRTKITSKGLQFLKGVRKIRLKFCNVDDSALPALAGAESVSLAYCNKVTDKGLASLAGCKYVNVSHCKNITDAGLRHLAGVRTLKASQCHRITNRGIAHLAASLERLAVDECRLGDDAFALLENVRVLSADKTGFGDRGCAALANAHTVSVCGTGVSDAGLHLFKSARLLSVAQCPALTKKGIEEFKSAHPDCRMYPHPEQLLDYEW